MLKEKNSYHFKLLLELKDYIHKFLTQIQSMEVMIMALDKKSIELLYQKRAKRYDFSANTYYLLGIREFAYRHLWESVARHLTLIEFKELYFGGIYLCVGEAT